MTMYQASPKLCKFIKAKCGLHEPVSRDTLPEVSVMIAEGKEPEVMPIWNGGSDLTIYPDAETNYAFRAWHDRLHIRERAEFNAKGEWIVTQAHHNEMSLYGAYYGLSYVDHLAVYFDVWGQLVYSEKHDGQFPHNQAAFIAACFAEGITRATAKEF